MEPTSVVQGHGDFRKDKLMTNDYDTSGPEELITLTQLSERTQISLRTLRDWRKEKTLPPELFISIPGKRCIRCRWNRFLAWLDSLPAGFQLRPPAPRQA